MNRMIFVLLLFMEGHYSRSHSTTIKDEDVQFFEQLGENNYLIPMISEKFQIRESLDASIGETDHLALKTSIEHQPTFNSTALMTQEYMVSKLIIDMYITQKYVRICHPFFQIL